MLEAMSNEKPPPKPSDAPLTMDTQTLPPPNGASTQVDLELPPVDDAITADDVPAVETR
jgi:hypothetical protein